MDTIITRNLFTKKAEILRYLRDRAAESHSEIVRIYGEKDFKDRSAAINKAITLTTTNLKTIIFQRALSQGWSKDEILKNILIVTYCSYISWNIDLSQETNNYFSQEDLTKYLTW
jgi:hypothetical protein